MELEEACGLKKGTSVRALSSWLSPGHISEGNIYVLQEDSIPLYARSWLDGLISRQRRESEPACNALLPLIDDDGKYAEPTHLAFVVVK